MGKQTSVIKTCNQNRRSCGIVPTEVTPEHVNHFKVSSMSAYMDRQFTGEREKNQNPKVGLDHLSDVED